MTVHHSVVIPTKNRPYALRRAVQAALNAAGPEGEVVVVDDGSDQPAAEVLADLRCSSLRVERNQGDAGASGARNHGALIARGRLLFFADDDDEIIPDYVAETVRYASAADAACFGFSLTLRQEDGKPCKKSRLHLKTGVMSGHAGFRDRLCGAGEGFWIDRGLFLSLGGFDPALCIDEDTDLCVRLSIAGHRPYYSSRPGMRIGGADLSGTPADRLTSSTPAAQALACWRRTYEKSALLLPRADRWHLASRYVRQLIRHRQAGEAYRFALAQRPASFATALAALCTVKTTARAVRK